MHDHALKCWKQRALALDNVDAHRSFTAGMCTQRVPAKDPVSLPVSSKSIHSSRSLDLGAAVAVGVVGELLVALASEPTPDALWPNANEVHRSMRLGGRRGCFLRTFCGLAADSEGVLDDPQIAFTDSRSREPLGRVPTWRGPRTTGARPLTHQGPDRGTYRRARLRMGTSSGPRTCGRSWPTVGTAAPSALAGRTW